MKTIERIKCSTPDFAKENVAKLLALFPECAGEQGEVDFDKLRQTLSSSVIEGNVALVACLDPKAKMTTEFFLEVAKLKPACAFFRDDAFADDSARTNLQQAFDQFSPTTSIKVI